MKYFIFTLLLAFNLNLSAQPVKNAWLIQLGQNHDACLRSYLDVVNSVDSDEAQKLLDWVNRTHDQGHSAYLFFEIPNDKNFIYQKIDKPNDRREFNSGFTYFYLKDTDSSDCQNISQLDLLKRYACYTNKDFFESHMWGSADSGKTINDVLKNNYEILLYDASVFYFLHSFIKTNYPNIIKEFHSVIKTRYKNDPYVAILDSLGIVPSLKHKKLFKKSNLPPNEKNLKLFNAIDALSNNDLIFMSPTKAYGAGLEAEAIVLHKKDYVKDTKGYLLRYNIFDELDKAMTEYGFKWNGKYWVL